MAAAGFRLSISNCSNWGLPEATRELISNLHDAVSSATPRDVAIEYRAVTLGPRKMHYNVHKGATFFGAIEWSADTGVLHLLNLGESMTLDNIRNIGSSRKRGSRAIGQFGEGLKSALAPLVRNQCTVTFAVPTGTWTFYAVANPDDPDDALLAMTSTAFGPKLPGIASSEWTRVTVTGIKEKDQIAWDRFLFLMKDLGEMRIYHRYVRPALVFQNALKGRDGVLGERLCM